MEKFPQVSGGHAEYFSSLPGGCFPHHGEDIFRNSLAAVLSSDSCIEREQIIITSLKSHFLKKILSSPLEVERLLPHVIAATGSVEAAKAMIESAKINPFLRSKFFGDLASGLESMKKRSPAAQNAADKVAALRQFRRSHQELLPSPYFVNSAAIGMEKARQGGRKMFDGFIPYNSMKHFKDGEVVMDDVPDEAQPHQLTAGGGSVNIHAKMSTYHLHHILGTQLRELKQEEELAKLAAESCPESQQVEAYKALQQELFATYGDMDSLDKLYSSLEAEKGRRAVKQGAQGEFDAWSCGSTNILSPIFDQLPAHEQSLFSHNKNVFVEWVLKCHHLSLTDAEAAAAQPFLSAATPEGVLPRSTGAVAERAPLFYAFCKHVAKRPCYGVGTSYKFNIGPYNGELDVVVVEIENIRPPESKKSAKGKEPTFTSAKVEVSKILGFVEVKLNPADLIYARRQRVKLQDAINAYFNNRKLYKDAQLTKGYVYFSDKSTIDGNIQMSAVAHCVSSTEDGQPTLRYCQYATTRDPAALGKLPVYSKFAHIASKQLGFALEYFVRDALTSVGYLTGSALPHIGRLTDLMLHSERFSRYNLKFFMKSLAIEMEKWYKKENSDRPHDAPALITPKGVFDECTSVGQPIVFFDPSPLTSK